MKRLFSVFTGGFALFSIFFGAGNLVFPLQLGALIENGWHWAVLGLCFTAVLMPALGFFSMVLCEGSYKQFFAIIGRIPAIVLITSTLLVIGPCGALPRNIALAYASFQVVFPNLSIWLFSAIGSIVIFALSFRESNIMGLLGKALTPMLLSLILLLFFCGFYFADNALGISKITGSAFVIGLKEGYQTLDLILAIFASSFLYPALLESCKKDRTLTIKKFSLLVSLVAAVLLIIVYVGFCYFAATISHHLIEVPQELMLLELSRYYLGDIGAYLTMALATLACLTTAIALAAIFSKFLKNELFEGKLRYEYCLAITLAISYFFAIMSFQGIVAILGPVLEIFYPILIALCAYNMVIKQYGVEALAQLKTNS